MAIDLRKEHYDIDENRPPLTVYPENGQPEIYTPSEANAVSAKEKYPTHSEKTAAYDTPAPLRTEKAHKDPRIAVAAVAVTVIAVSAAVVIRSLPKAETETVSAPDPYTTENFYLDKTENIYVHSQNTDVIFKYDFSSSENISVRGINSSDGYFTASENKGTLFITCECDEDKYYSGEAEPVEVIFSRRFDGNISVGGSCCNISLEAGGTLSVEIESGNIAAGGLSCGTASLITNNGNISVNNSETDSMELYTAAGNIDIMDSEAGETLRADTDMGKIDARRVRSAGNTVLHAYSGERYTSEGISGEIYGENLLFEGDTDLAAGNDGIRLYDTDLRDTTIFSAGDVLMYLYRSEDTYKIVGIDPDSTVTTQNSDGEYSIKINSQGSADILFDSYPPFAGE